MAFIVLDNSPELGCIQWADLHISYKGTTYEVADGYTDNRYVWWDYSDPYHLQATNDLPALTDDDVLVFFNKNGTHLTVPNTTVVDGGLIVSESILADALAANCVTSVKILAGAISADKIAAGAVGAEKIAAGAVIAEKIAAGAVLADKIGVDELSAITANLGTVTAGKIETEVLVVDKTAFTMNSILDGFGNGSDGVFNSTGNVTLPIATADASSVIKQYTSFTLNAGHTLTVNKRCRGLFIFCQGNVTINGTIDMNGKSACVLKENSLQRILQVPVGVYVLEVPAGSAGGGGGRGGRGYGDGGVQSTGGAGTPGMWFGGGAGGAGGGGGGGADNSNNNGGNGGNAGTSLIESAIGAGGTGGDTDAENGGTGGNLSGGGGAAGNWSSYSGGGGGGGGGFNPGGGGLSSTGGQPGVAGTAGTPYGGGLIVIISGGSITIGATGVVSANGGGGGRGGDGGRGGEHGGGGGGGQGGGGGGVAVFAYRGTFSNSGSVTVNGGMGGIKGKGGAGNDGQGADGVAGTNGTVGNIITAQV